MTLGLAMRLPYNDPASFPGTGSPPPPILQATKAGRRPGNEANDFITTLLGDYSFLPCPTFVGVSRTMAALVSWTGSTVLMLCSGVAPPTSCTSPSGDSLRHVKSSEQINQPNLPCRTQHICVQTKICNILFDCMSACWVHILFMLLDLLIFIFMTWVFVTNICTVRNKHNIVILLL